MKRRGFLWILFGIVWALVTLWPLRVRDLLVGLVRPRVDTSLPPGRLSAADLDAVLAFAEVLVAERALGPAERGPLVDHINDRALGTPGFLSLYQDTARVLNRLTAQPFGQLAFAERLALVERRRLLASGVHVLEYVWPSNRETLLTRQFVVPDLIWAYYTSPAGWAVVGYDTSPGQCGTLTRYTHEEG